MWKPDYLVMAILGDTCINMGHVLRNSPNVETCQNFEFRSTYVPLMGTQCRVLKLTQWKEERHQEIVSPVSGNRDTCFWYSSSVSLPRFESQVYRGAIKSHMQRAKDLWTVLHPDCHWSKCSVVYVSDVFRDLRFSSTYREDNNDGTDACCFSGYVNSDPCPWTW